MNDREKEVLRQMRDARIAAIKRRRSWRLSEKTMAIVEVRRLTSKLLGEEGEQQNGSM